MLKNLLGARGQSILVCLLLALASVGWAQDKDGLPSEIRGRYLVVSNSGGPGGFGQEFSLQDIQATGDQAFSAKLTWWTRDSRCVLRAEPISGRITSTGLAFSAKTKCDVAFDAELDRAGKEWQGKSITTSGPPIALELKAKASD